MKESCFSFKVGVLEPKSGCHDCPKGSCSSAPGAKMCKKCNYFEYQDQSGRKISFNSRLTVVVFR